MLLEILSWSAIIVLSISYWFQIWKIHIHREVRDISLTYNVLLAIGFGILTITAYQEKSLIFLVKQISTTIPVIIIIFQVLYHKDDHWHEEDEVDCTSCKKEMEPFWSHCAYCGSKRNEQV